MKPGTWRGLHWLAYLSWPVALAHTFGMGTDAAEPWVIALGILCVLSVGSALAWRFRVVARQRRFGAAAVDAVEPQKHLALTGGGRGSRS
jgi:sulfoxide reductase heme-binding subunit YedZ